MNRQCFARLLLTLLVLALAVRGQRWPVRLGPGFPKDVPLTVKYLETIGK
jgi:hypothetical protein